jgi:hypothetical protein
MLLNSSPREGIRLAFVLCALTLSTASAAADPTEVSAVGLLEAASCSSSSLRVLGMSFVSKDKNLKKTICQLSSSPDVSYVSVKGINKGSRISEMTSFSVVSKNDYAAGSTAVYINGTVSGQDSALGIFYIGEAAIVGSPVLPAIGTVVEVVGTQPVPGGEVIASTIVGSGIQSIVGSGVEATVSSGTQAIVGSGTQAIVGSGAQAIVGSGTQAIVGSGAQAIVGSGTQAIVGSGAQAIVGSGAQAIVGSGAQAIVGSGKQAIVGSGKQAIVGSGVSL